jgi:hypothetical protein
MGATTLPQLLDALLVALSDREGLAGVNIYTCPVSPEELGPEGIEFAEEVSVEQARASFGNTDLEESYTVSGSLLVAAPMPPGSGAVNRAAKAARDRCAELLHEISEELATNDTLDNEVRDVSIASQVWHQGMAPEAQLGRVCWVEFSLAVVARVTP